MAAAAAVPGPLAPGGAWKAGKLREVLKKLETAKFWDSLDYIGLWIKDIIAQGLFFVDILLVEKGRATDSLPVESTLLENMHDYDCDG